MIIGFILTSAIGVGGWFVRRRPLVLLSAGLYMLLGAVQLSPLADNLFRGTPRDLFGAAAVALVLALTIIRSR